MKNLLAWMGGVLVILLMLAGVAGLAFDSGTFATGLLYVSQNAGSVVTVSPNGKVTSFSAAGLALQLQRSSVRASRRRLRK
jgi:hypothetical protein